MRGKRFFNFVQACDLDLEHLNLDIILDIVLL